MAASKKQKQGGFVGYLSMPFFNARPIIDKKVKGRTFQKIDTFSFDESHVRALLSSQSLFESQTIVFSDVLTKDLLPFLKQSVLESVHDIFFVESEDFKWKQDFIVSVGGEVFGVQPKKAVSAKPKSYAFDVGASILDKNKKAAWLSYHKALQNGEAPEAIHSAVWWTIKQIVPASPIPRFAKYKKTYDSHALTALSMMWMKTLHESRIQGIELSLAIEKTILEL